MKTPREKRKEPKQREKQPQKAEQVYAHENELREQAQHETLGGCRTDCLRMRG